MYYPSKIWLELIGFSGTGNVFAIHNFLVIWHNITDENNNIKRVYKDKLADVTAAIVCLHGDPFLSFYHFRVVS